MSSRGEVRFLDVRKVAQREARTKLCDVQSFKRPPQDSLLSAMMLLSTSPPFVCLSLEDGPSPYYCYCLTKKWINLGQNSEVVQSEGCVTSASNDFSRSPPSLLPSFMLPFVACAVIKCRDGVTLHFGRSVSPDQR